jgi:hypothetical protein
LVTPAIGASTTGGSTSNGPIRNAAPVAARAGAEAVNWASV